MIRSKAYKYCPECGEKFIGTDKLDKLSCPNGHVYYISPKPTCSAIITNGEGKILLAKRGGNPGKDLWELPGGFISLGETLEETVRREIKEELGVNITVIDVVGGFPTVYPLRGVDYETVNIMVVAKIDNGSPTPASEVSEVRLVGSDEIAKLKFAFPVEKEKATYFLEKHSSKISVKLHRKLSRLESPQSPTFRQPQRNRQMAKRPII